MNKQIYAVEYNPLKTPEQLNIDIKILEVEYEDKFTGELKTVNNIEEVFNYGQRIIMVYFTDGTDEEITDVYQVYRRSK